MDDDDITTTRHHHDDDTPIPTPITGSRATLAAIYSAVNTSGLSVGQSALLSQLVSYCS